MAKEAEPKKDKAPKAKPESKGKKEVGEQEKGVKARLFERYQKEAVPALMKKFQFRSKMHEFMDRFISVALPRVRDFRGVSDKSFDGHGNYTVGIKEQIIFPEIDVDKVTRVTGMDITFVTTAKNDVEAYELLKELGMPFVKRQEIVQSETQSK
jgi:hypothetical protein